MKAEFVEFIHCPSCKGSLEVVVGEEDAREIRSGELTCQEGHSFPIEDGIIKFQAGFGHEDVQKEIEYEDATFATSKPVFKDPEFIAGCPETLVEVFPHTFAFGPGFRDLIDTLDIQPGQWVLDIGTGPCWSSRLLAERGANVIALDVNDAEFYGLKTSDIQFENHDVYFERILESMTDLPLGDGTIDAITCNASLHHTPDLKKTLEEFYRVLKPGGKLGAANEEWLSTRIVVSRWINHSLLGKPEAEEEGSHHDLSYGELEKISRAAGFDLSYRVSEPFHERIKERMGSFAQAASRVVLKPTVMLKQIKSVTTLLEKPSRA